jgi:hypothetical protein
MARCSLRRSGYAGSGDSKVRVFETLNLRVVCHPRLVENDLSVCTARDGTACLFEVFAYGCGVVVRHDDRVPFAR